MQTEVNIILFAITTNIFYSSKYHNGVEIGKNFPNVVRDNFIGANIVVLLLTENFYNSYYCVCEEGAAWISVNKEIVPILLGNLNFGDMKGFIDSSTKSFSPKYSETEELYTYFAKRSCVDFDEKEANHFVGPYNKKMKYDFYTKNGLIIPCLYVKINKQSFSRITVSPIMEAEITKMSIRELLSTNGYKGCRVYQSTIPIRF